MRLKPFVLLLVTFLFIWILSATALAADDDGDGYDDNEFTKIQAFLNLTSADGVHTNGWKLNPAYDPDDTATWTGIFWSGFPYKHIYGIDVTGKGLAGPLDVSGFTNLSTCYCGYNRLTQVNAAGCSAMTNLSCNDNLLASLDVSGCTSLDALDCGGNQMESLDVSDCAAMRFLGCGNNKLTLLDLNSCANLLMLAINTNQITSLNLTACTKLASVTCPLNPLLVSLDVSGLTDLTYLNCYECDLAALDVGGCPALELLYCYDNRLTALDVSDCAALETFLCYNNNLTEMDVSANTNLTAFSCANNPIASVHATLSGGSVALHASKGGVVALSNSGEGNPFASAVPDSGWLFAGWTSSGTPVSTATQLELTAGNNYDLTANFIPVLTLKPSRADGKIYKGGRITLTPNIPGGTWNYDKKYLSGKAAETAMEFTGLMAGTARATYTAGTQSAYIDIVISEAALPATGQDFTPALWLLTLAAGAGCVAFIPVLRRRRRQRAYS